MNIERIESADKIRFQLDGISTGWMNRDDSFVERIDDDRINPDFQKMHLIKEIQIKNRLDEGISFLNAKKYPKAIECFDEVIYYDSNYAEALLFKSKALRCQGHFIKALRYYKKAVKADSSFKDIEYHKSLQRQANDERSNFPKIKSDIYAGDEYFARGEFANALESYNRALSDHSRFKEKILFKLLNKKATTLFKLGLFEESLSCFSKSLEANPNDYAIFGIGKCRYELGLEIADEFKKPLKITKQQSLNQIEILNDLGFYKESLLICSEILENHFVLDELYFSLVDCKKKASNC